ncbi:MAG: PHP domain-containing protein [Bryobacterales bacterium]
MPTEIHAASGFSFLEGALRPRGSDHRSPAPRVRRPSLCGDRDSVSGAPRFFKAARQAGVKAVGAEISLEQPNIKKGVRNAELDRRLTVLVESRRGYQNLCRLLTRMNLRAPKGEGRATWQDLDDFSPGLVALLHDVRDEDPVRGIFGPRNVYVELQRHMRREQERDNQARIELARRYGLPLVASNAVRYATESRKALYDVFTCLRFKRKLDDAGRLLDSNSERFLKSDKALQHLFRDIPEALVNSRELGRRLDFTLGNLGYEFPKYPLPPGETPTSYLRQIALRGAAERYRDSPHREKAFRQIEHELGVIERLHLEGYFLIVWDIVEYARRNGILSRHAIGGQLRRLLRLRHHCRRPSRHGAAL